MTSNIKIYVSCHKNCFVPDRPFLYPIQVGAQDASIRFSNMLHDDIGENISHKNPLYCELTAQYWAWKNDDADYYGFFHYRRYLCFTEQIMAHNSFQDVVIKDLNNSILDEIGIKKELMEKTINSYDILSSPEVNLKELNKRIKSNKQQYELTPYLYKEDLDVLLAILEEKYPEYYETALEYFNLDKGYFCNMFIMRKEIFFSYCEWLFDILEEQEKRRDYTNYNIDAYRVIGHLAERLYGIYYTHLKKQGKYKCKELQRTLFLNTEVKNILNPIDAQNNVVIALATNDYFVPYAGTMLLSLIDNASDYKFYDIIILSEDISIKNKARINTIVKNRKNFRVNFLNPNSLLEHYTFYTRGHFSVETYYRLVLPELLPDYNKVLYLDSDMIIRRDIAELYDLDLESYLIAACYDADTSGLYNGYEPNKKNYMDSVLKMVNPYSYFQAGTLLINLKEFRKMYTTKQILDYATSYEFQLLDQDILNHLCEGKVKYIDMEWNMMVDYDNKRINEIIRLAPQWQYKEYIKARSAPSIIHYAGPQKPWFFPEMDFGDEFWRYAKKTPWYEIMLYRMTNNSSQILYQKEHPKEAKYKKIFDGNNCLFPYGSKRRESLKKIYYYLYNGLKR